MVEIKVKVVFGKEKTFLYEMSSWKVYQINQW